MTPEEGFESAQYLAGWAKEQFDELEALLKSLDDSGTATVVEELNAKTGRLEAKIRFKPVPHRVRGLTNNIIKDLRDALDQATSAASMLVSGKFQRNAHFAFGESPDDFDVAVTRNQCKQIPTALHATLKRYEPYPTGDVWVGGNNFLRLLGRVSGPHKHRFTLQVLPDLQNLTLTGLTIKGGSGSTDIGCGFNRDGDYILMSFGPGGNARFDELTITTFVAFADAKLKGIPIMAFLSANCATVGNIVQDLQAKALALSGKG